ncbi:MAG TPA: hypothetical protein VN639_05845 [Azonexus sp.]|nr:hypothetical protein [Azonexus sp.]
MSRTCPDPLRQRGFSIVAAIFILVLLAALAGFVVSVSRTQHITAVQDLQGARALQAANAGIEWGIHQSLTNANYQCVKDCTLSGCTPGTSGSASGTLAALTGDLADFSVAVNCSCTPVCDAGTPVKMITLVVTATTGPERSIARIERQLQAKLRNAE